MTDTFKTLLSKPSTRYILVGGSTFVLDAGLLYFLHNNLGYSIPLSTSIAYWFAVLYNFTLLRFWTFKHTRIKGLHKHVVLYFVLLGVNYIFAVSFISFLSNYIYFMFAKVIATALQTCWNYFLFKHVIFKEN